MFTLVCCLVVRFMVGLVLDLVSGSLVVTHTYRRPIKCNVLAIRIYSLRPNPIRRSDRAA